MHIDIQLSRRRIALLVGAVALLVVAGAAYATIPDGGGVYTACRLNGVGTIRLIDPSGLSSSLLSHCTSVETQVSWNQKGQAGQPGTSPTVTQLSAGDSHCPAGGAAITDANGATAYACSGQSFAGTFTSPNGQFSLSVADNGVQLVGPNATISISGNGNVTVKGDQIETVANNETNTVSIDRNEKVGGNDSLKVSGNRTEKVSGQLGVQAAAALDLSGSTVGITRSAACKPVARVGDLVNPVAGVILTGSPTLCID